MVSFTCLAIRGKLEGGECRPTAVDRRTGAGATFKSEVGPTIRADARTIGPAEGLHRCGHLRILPHHLRNVDRVIGVNREAVRLLGLIEARACLDIHPLDEGLRERDALGIAKGREAAAAAILDHHLRRTLDEDARRNAKQPCLAAVDGWIRFKDVAPRGPDGFAEELRDVEQHREPRGVEVFTV